MKPFFSKQSISNLTKSTRTRPSIFPSIHRNTTTPIPLAVAPSSSSSSSQRNLHHFFNFQNPPQKSISFISKSLYSLQHTEPLETESDDEEYDGPMNEFLSRFVWIIRGKLSEAYPNCNKETIEGMLLIIVQKVVAEMDKGNFDEMLDSASKTQPVDISQDLWRTVWEVSNSILEDMRREKKKEEMKKLLHDEDVKEMCRFAGEIGIRGDMLRELRFKWAGEKLEEKEFYQSLERLREECRDEEENVTESRDGNAVDDGPEGLDSGNEKPAKQVVLPKRSGKIKYKIYGLDLSSDKWAEVADRIHEAEKLITPEEPKEITGKCKIVTERILGLKVKEDPSPVLAEWIELLRPSRVDWLALLDRLNERNSALYLKIAELILDEESFGTNIRDYSKLIDAHAKGNRIEDAERILKKMTDKGMEPDILTLTILVHMYSKAGNLDLAKDAFEKLRSQGFQPDMRAYNSMIMAYVNAGLPKSGESLMREMESRDYKPTKEIYMELLRAFAQRGHVDGAQRIVNTMQFAGFQPTLESSTLLVEAYGQAGDPDQARNNFDYMMQSGHKPDDRCTASMLAAYEKKNLLDKALSLLLDLEKDGFEPGIATYTVLIDWFGKLQLVDEAEQVLGKITEKGDVPFKVHVSLCDMYARACIERKALKSLGIVKSKKELLRAEDFERIIHGLLAGGLAQEASKIQELMQKRGFTPSEAIKVALMAAQTVPRQRPKMR